MKSRATRNIQIEKQTRRVLSNAAGARSQSDAKPTAAKKAKKAVKKGSAKTTVKKKLNAASNVIGFCDGYWEWFLRSDELPPYEITGKYLFFSLDRELLIRIATEEIENRGFHRAKTHMSNVAPPSGEYVLCLYYKDDSRKRELAAKYQHNPELKYRYWKSDEDTHAGKYSEEFLKKLSKDQREFFLKGSSVK